MRISVVISTLGLSKSFSLLLESLAAQTRPAHQIIVVDQGEGSAVSDLVKIWQDVLPITRLTSARGVSLGRNIGWRALGQCEVVAFPDDDCSYAVNGLEMMLGEFEASDVVALSGRLVGITQRVSFDGGRCDIDRKTVWTKAIEATTIYRMTALEALSGFDENLGIGAPTSWQSGEGTDLLLRAMSNGGRVVYNPSIVVTEHQEPMVDAHYLRKARLYARGTGRVYRTRYGMPHRLWIVSKSLAGVGFFILSGKPFQGRVKWQVLRGRIEGLTSTK